MISLSSRKGCKCRKELFKLNLTLKSRRLRATWWSNICGHKMRVGRFEFFLLFRLHERGLNTREKVKNMTSHEQFFHP